MRQLLYSRAKKVKDSAGREVDVLMDPEAKKIAAQFDCTMHDVYIEALEKGICPGRYIRNGNTISLEEQLLLIRSRVTVIGAGGLGGNVILLLARLGIGHLVVVDHDEFDETNLNRQALCSEIAIGKSKSEEAVAAVGAINPGVLVTPRRVKIDPSNAVEILDGSDVVVDALDNVPDRFVLEAASKALGIPLVHGALAGFEGRLMTIYPEDPGLKQLYGKSVEESGNSIRPEAVLGTPALMPALIATLQATEVIKIILERGKVFRNVMVHVDLETGEMSRFTF